MAGAVSALQAILTTAIKWSDQMTVANQSYQKLDVVAILARCKRLQFLTVAGIVTLIAMALA